MATSMPNPQASAPQPQGGDAGASAQANPLQQMLGRVALVLRQLATQNTVVQPELQQASQFCIQALQKVSQASSSAPQTAPAPPEQ